ncbi:MAG TPA: histidine phosphatase family protein [Mycobacteriales bacterium]|nr:histidine phosphatase family protein [Mycobacteriales bacterium]
MTAAVTPAGPSGNGSNGRRRIVFWRHGQTSWNAEHRFQGAADVPLDDVGRTQAEQAARLLAGLRPHAIVASDLVRATETAAALGRVTGLPVSTDPRLRERSGGEWEGLTDVEIRERYPERWAVWEPVGGETLEEVATRFSAAVRDAAEQLGDGEVLVVVSHGSAIRAGIAALLELPEPLWRRLESLSNCAWSVLREVPAGWRMSGWRLLEHNAGSLPEPVLSDDR